MVCDKRSSHSHSRIHCLNPYSIGIWSATRGDSSCWWRAQEVLILILLEYGLRHQLDAEEEEEE